MKFNTYLVLVSLVCFLIALSIGLWAVSLSVKTANSDTIFLLAILGMILNGVVMVYFIIKDC